jgi:hypothetical protein
MRYTARMPRRLLLLFLTLFAVAGVILLWRWHYPESLPESGKWLSVLYGLMWLALIATGWRIRRLDAPAALEYAAIWLVIIIALMLFYDLLKRFS